ncbi:MAG: hypothetical protein ACYC5O_12770 [Anaerolineae bacterium]
MDRGALAGISNWPLIQQRYEAWWQCEVVDRVLIGITAPTATLTDEAVPPEQLHDYWTNPERVLTRIDRHLAATYFAGDAFPIAQPVGGGLVAVLAAFLGSPVRLIDTRTAWSGRIIDDWASRPTFAFDAGNEWWQRVARLLAAAAECAPGRYYVSVPDLNGPGEVLARLRGTAPLAIDLLESPDAVLAAMPEINQAWYRYWQACNGIIHQHVGGYTFWMGMWSELPATDLQTDFSIMVSKAMFDRFFLPYVEEQTRLVQRTIYHLDGPGAVRHLDSLLDLPLLTAIQWVPGAGAPPVSYWLPLLRRCQARGKGLWLWAEPWEVPILLSELEPEGLCIKTHCASPAEADDLVALAARSQRRRQWLVPGSEAWEERGA